ncbi:hypothetical protein PsW64_01979 [Pseudovibrio sp. W64]|uniref:DUF6468 domain-containing protein n=1 Tax=unclassified Pseudovibrio TaxID=2627060 RepID=UPI0007AEC0F0|nr:MULTISPECIES: DUF6468 domain-containing protein [unclassified Pseudovibrio]KZK81380.1 hypothetical protein PsAD13_04331 [Pseudovibrio sp. Ad13]KZK83812.1 hypothetical protein PsW64_01979 [Pseudovibrio sp. W64]KZK93523.1 hypothetical protein PsAD5_03240 [Pseudovibrio sp. Ad5]KZL05725.1 hypothetical protein PsAD26_04526 [Pseudovibrio sp. Ad26]
MSLGLIIECIVAVLLVITIGYCWTLNRRLSRLRSDEESLRATISELITATEIAERAIMGLKSTCGNADRTLGVRLGEAEAVSRKLTNQLGAGEDVLDRIGGVADRALADRDTRVAAPAAPMSRTYETAAEGLAAGIIAEQETMHPAETRSAPAPKAATRSVTRDIREAANESAARLERFRRQAQDRVA